MTPPNSIAASSSPATPHNIARTGGAENPSAAAVRAKFPDAVVRTTVGWGETTLVVTLNHVYEIIEWLHHDPAQQYHYLSDVTAVEYRDTEEPFTVVWHLRSIAHRRFLRIKVEMPRGAPLEVPSVWPIYKGADWLERECYDMFGLRFKGHPDLRRILMWEQYAEGFPLRKNFPLRGRFSRSEQLRQALSANPEARYSMEELSIADAFQELPDSMRKRIRAGEQTGE